MSKETRLLIAIVFFSLGGLLVTRALFMPSSMSIPVPMSSSALTFDFSDLNKLSILLGAVFIIVGLGVVLLVKPKPDSE